MLKARCVKPCKHQYLSCQQGWIPVSSRYNRDPNLLRDGDGNLYCWEGRFLTVYDKICEDCGTMLVPNGSQETETSIIAIFKCPDCNKIYKMEVIE